MISANSAWPSSSINPRNCPWRTACMPEPAPTCGPFAEFLPTVRQRLRALTGQPEQLTLVFDAGASSRQNLEGLVGYVTALPPRAMWHYWLRRLVNRLRLPYPLESWCRPGGPAA